MPYHENIVLEHPDTCEEVKLYITFSYSKPEKPSLYCPGCDEEFEIHEVRDDKGNYYADELVWEDAQIIEGLKQC